MADKLRAQTAQLNAALLRAEARDALPGSTAADAERWHRYAARMICFLCFVLFSFPSFESDLRSREAELVAQLAAARDAQRALERALEAQASGEGAALLPYVRREREVVEARAELLALTVARLETRCDAAERERESLRAELRVAAERRRECFVVVCSCVCIFVSLISIARQGGE